MLAEWDPNAMCEVASMVVVFENIIYVLIKGEKKSLLYSLFFVLWFCKCIINIEFE